MNYKTPGVYVEEINKFPPSVAAVATAIPAFIGYTEIAIDEDGNDLTDFPVVKRITSLKDYETAFGFAMDQAMTVEVIGDEPSAISSVIGTNYRMYHAVQIYFDNGGGPCYIIAVDKYSGTPTETIASAKLLEGLNALKKKDEPTLILFPDGVGMDANTSYYEVLKQAINQCALLGDRFTICELFNDDDVANFRTSIGTNHLKYAAAYHPWLHTNINVKYVKQNITFSAADSPVNTSDILNGKKWGDLANIIALESIQRNLDQAASSTTIILNNANTLLTVDLPVAPTDAAAIAIALEAAQTARMAAGLALTAIADSGEDTAAMTTELENINTALTDATAATNQQEAEDAVINNNNLAAFMSNIGTHISTAKAEIDSDLTTALAVESLLDIKAAYNTEFENKLKTLLAQQYVAMPPGAAVAGVYAAVDRTRGVWKAPANVSLNRVISPALKITDADQETLNIDPNGKSINAIRAFTGKGILVWGARTLAGNDNEWRYVSVRRFFNMVEESVKKASEGFVFEPNDANTWVKVRAMIENFLTLQWRAGALAGAKKEDAFYVKVGLGQTMTAIDVLEGRMIVEIGMATVRPAEFIILQFSHKMQES